MRVVSNTSPLCNLAVIGRLDLLKRRYQEVRIPPAVAVELSALSHVDAKSRLVAAQQEGWIVVETPPVPPPPLAFPLDAGETEAIALAVAVPTDVPLIDEKRGREAARRLGLAVGGVLGELLHARQADWIPNLRAEIDRLRSEAGFFVDSQIERFILSQVGE